MSHVTFALCMFTTYFISSAAGVTVMMTLVGLAWAITTWAPFTLISMDVSNIRTIESPLLEKENGAGIMIGLLNVAICLPQIVAVIASSVVFWWLGDASNGTSTVCLLNFGGVSALLAACFCARIQQAADHQHVISKV